MKDKQINSRAALDLVERIRKIVSALPMTSEVIDGHGHTVFKVTGKTFVMMGQNDAGQASLSIKADKKDQDAIIKEGNFKKTPYIGHHGWVSVENTQKIKWKRLEGLIVNGFVLAAPKKLAQRLKEK